MFEFDYSVERNINSAVLVVTLATLLYGLISWCVLPKFRNYRNYVFFNALLSNFLKIMAYHFSGLLCLQLKTRFYLRRYFSTTNTYWLLVISHMFYIDIVKVFNGNTRRRFLKSSFLGWGVPLITLLFVFF